MLVTGRDGVQVALGLPILLWVYPLFKMSSGLALGSYEN